MGCWSFFPPVLPLYFSYYLLTSADTSCDRGTKESFSEVFAVVTPSDAPWMHLLSGEWRRGPEHICVDITKDTKQKIKQLELM